MAKTKIDLELAARVDGLAKEYGDTSHAFAKRCGIDSSGMRKKLLGQEGFSRRNIIDICKALGVNREWLETGNGEKYSSPIYNNVGGTMNIGSHVESSVQVAMGAGGEDLDKVSALMENALTKDMYIKSLEQQIIELRKQNQSLLQLLSQRK